MSKHTPGPWRMHGELINSDKREIAEVRDFKSNTETGANARLIAAAPELLEIVKAYRNLLKTMAHTEGEVRTFQHIECVIAKVERGES